MDLVNKTGGFTVPELARALKVSPSSLYNHVAGREQIVELLRERAMSDVALPADDPQRPWTDVVADIMRSYRQSYARYPRLIPLLTSHAVNSDHALTMYNVLAVAFDRAGFDPADTLRAITLIDSFVLGSALDVAAPDEPWQAGADVALMVDINQGYTVGAALAPALVRAAASRTTPTRPEPVRRAAAVAVAAAARVLQRGPQQGGAGQACEVVRDTCARVADGALCDAWKKRRDETEVAFRFARPENTEKNRADYERVVRIVAESSCGQ